MRAFVRTGNPDGAVRCGSRWLPVGPTRGLRFTPEIARSGSKTGRHARPSVVAEFGAHFMMLGRGHSTCRTRREFGFVECLGMG